MASFIERSEHTSKIITLPAIPDCVQSDTEKVALARAWFRCWTRPGIWLSRMPAAWQNREIRSHSGKFRDMNRLLTTKNSLALFEKEWLPKLLETFSEPVSGGRFRLIGRELSLELGGTWAYCQSCRTAQRPFPERKTCVHCGHEAAELIDPDTDQVFVARKGYYRASTLEASRKPPLAPMALIAAEHTAQINAAQENEIFSKAEEHELLFQDVNLGPGDSGRDRPAIDVLSCTTTMEVGIDIGALSGVALRNMPPARANYQQRAGRAGRRGNAVATVTAFGSADSHDEHYFEHPDLMIRGAVDDPTLTLNNPVIARRHVTAYLLQRYHQERLPEISPADQPHLFAVLGTVVDFRNPDKALNRDDFEQWLISNESALKDDVAEWLPKEIGADERQNLLDGIINETLNPVDEAIGYFSGAPDKDGEVAEEVDVESLESQEEEGNEAPGKDPASENLLDRLLYKAVLPRYAFPTDVAAFHVFDEARSTRFRHAFHFTPSQGLPEALSQYAPGKEVWIDNRLWTSGAVYSPIQGDRYDSWQRRRLYYECKDCRFASTVAIDAGEPGDTKDCEGCGGKGTFGPARNWLRPPGFAHPVNKEEGTSPDDQPARSYATRAKLTMPTPADPAGWQEVNHRLRVYNTRPHLLVTNRGPRDEGYNYCTRCGLIEPTASSTSELGAAHRKPYPDPQEPNCSGGRMTTGLTLGTDFITDVLLVSITVDSPLTLRPRLLASDVALRTLSDALTIAACRILELGSNELQAEYRPALTAAGRDGREAEIYIYDTLPGGAGFAERVGRLGLTVFEEALRILESCPEDCDRSCYRCLRSYKNKFEHDLLDRHLGAGLLRYLITGDFPMVDLERLESSTTLLFEDLNRQGSTDLTVNMNHPVTLEDGSAVVAPISLERSDGRQFIIGLSGPLTPNVPANVTLKEVPESSGSILVFLYDEILVRRNLPSATNLVLEDARKA